MIKQIWSSILFTWYHINSYSKIKMKSLMTAKGTLKLGRVGGGICLLATASCFIGSYLGFGSALYWAGWMNLGLTVSIGICQFDTLREYEEEVLDGI